MSNPPPEQIGQVPHVCITDSGSYRAGTTLPIDYSHSFRPELPAILAHLAVLLLLPYRGNRLFVVRYSTVLWICGSVSPLYVVMASEPTNTQELVVVVVVTVCPNVP